jgi:hypothetical protein
MQFFRRTKISHPHAPDLPLYYTPGPVFTEPAMAAIYNTTLQNPPNRILGGGYPIAMQFRSLQDASLVARQAVPIVGLGGPQAGQFALSQLTNADGSFDNGGADDVQAN